MLRTCLGCASPQVTSTSVPQAGSSWEDSTSQVASTSSPKQLVFRQSVLRQVVPGKTVLLRQLAPLPPKQLMPRQRALILRWSVLLPLRQAGLGKIALLRQPALLPRQAAPLSQPALIPHKQLVPRQ